jgi:hypothetical protein
MDEDKANPGKKLRTLLSGGNTSPLARLPKKLNINLPPKAAKKEKALAEPAEPVASTKGVFSKKKPKKESADALPAPKPVTSPLKSMKVNFWPPFWTIASILSLIMNVVLIVVLLTLLPLAKKFDLNMVKSLDIGTITGQSTQLLGDLYTNFEKMDRAHITTSVPVESTIPVKFDLQLNQQTNVVLSQAVTIDNARVTVKTGGLNITNAVTTIVLPQGTTLPIVLNLTVPVDTTVPVKLNVNVDIPLSQTQLHEPFSGLQEAVKPFYCMMNPKAVNLDQQPICK